VAAKSTENLNRIIDTDEIKARNGAQFAPDPDAPSASEMDEGDNNGTVDRVQAAQVGENAKPEPTEPVRTKVRIDAEPKLSVVGESKPKHSIASIRLDPATVENATADEQLAIPVGKPHGQTWFRVRPDAEYRLQVAGLQLKDEIDDGFYILSYEMQSDLLFTEAHRYTLYVVMPRLSKSVRVWPVKQPDGDGKWNDWSRTADEAAHIGMTEWVRLIPDRASGGYKVRRQRDGEKSRDPIWPDLTMDEIVEKAFFDRGKLITGYDHPVMKLLAARD
jgi:hypothetical protein